MLLQDLFLLKDALREKLDVNKIQIQKAHRVGAKRRR